jgi:hypothetical protein
MKLEGTFCQSHGLHLKQLFEFNYSLKLSIMKNLIMSLAAIAILAGLSVTGCKKDTAASTDNNAFSSDVNNAKSLELRALAYNDTLVNYWETARVRWHNHYLMHYDSLYYRNDSLFTLMYNTFCSQAYQLWCQDEGL